MKLKEIITEEAGSDTTSTGSFARVASPYSSVSSVGTLEYSAKPHKIKLFRRNPNNENCAECVATISRQTGKGWKFTPTKAWRGQQLPHFGQLHNAKSPHKGKKTLSSNLKDVLNHWGIKHDDVKEMEG